MGHVTNRALQIVDFLNFFQKIPKNSLTMTFSLTNHESFSHIGSAQAPERTVESAGNCFRDAAQVNTSAPEQLKNNHETSLVTRPPLTEIDFWNLNLSSIV